MFNKKLSITIGIILTIAFFASLIAALSSDEEFENKLKVKAGNEYKCDMLHQGFQMKDGHKCCCCGSKCTEMKCDRSKSTHQNEKCAMAEKKCNPTECSHHVDKHTNLKEEKKCEPSDCAKHQPLGLEGEKKCDSVTCTGKCPSKSSGSN
jgi:hypothetical protein